MKKHLIFFLLTLFFTLPLFAFADGGIFVPPRTDVYMQETRQRAAIFYENGVETLILSTNFKGTAPDFGWVIPTPSRPEVSKGSMAVFQNLETITQHSYQWDKNYGYAIGGFGASYRATEKTPYVAVIETKKVDYYTIDVLESNDADALSRWLGAHGYHFPQKERYVLNDYVQNGWYFTAVKVDTAAQGSERVNLALEEGHATPLKLVFATPNIVFPLKISSIKPDPNELIPTPAPAQTSESAVSYVQGINDKAALLPKGAYLSGTFSAPETVTIPEGTFQMWFKPSQTLDGHIYTLFTLTTRTRDAIKIESLNEKLLVTVGGSSWVTFYSPSIQNLIATNAWNHLAITFTRNRVPILYLNGQETPLTTANAIAFAQPLYIAAPVMDISIGDRTNEYFKGTIAYDDIILEDKVYQTEEIKKVYESRTSIPAPELGPNFALFVKFDSSLVFTVSLPNTIGAHPRMLNLQTIEKAPQSKSVQLPPKTTPAPPVPIELYLIADHRQTSGGFSIPYAGWIRAQTIKELGVDTNGNPLIQPAGKKYFLTKLTRIMRQEEMTEDIFPVKAPNDDLINARELPLVSSQGAVVWFVAISILLSTALLGLLVWWSLGKKHVQ